MRKAILKFLDATVGVVVCWLLGLATYLAGRHGAARAETAQGTPRRILIIRPGGIGDMVLLLPALKELQRRFADAEIDVLCESRNAGVLALAGSGWRAVCYDTNPLKLLFTLASRRYNFVIDTEQFHNFSAVFGLLAGGRVRVGFKINPHRNALYTHLVDYAVDGAETEQFARLLAPIGIGRADVSPAGIIAGERPVTPNLARQLRPLPGEYAVIHVGAGSRYKLWAPDNFARVAEGLTEKHGLGIALTGSHAERKYATQVADMLAGGPCRNVVLLAGATDLAEAAAALQRSRLFVGSDSGLAHVAVALDVPTVVLFGPSDPRKWGFESERHAVVARRLPCAPCFIFGYHRPCRSIACMAGLSAEDVLAACDEVLGRSH